ncbi:MAG: sigma 54-interacting transcriptional regulator [Desulfobacterales bacterium]
MTRVEPTFADLMIDAMAEGVFTLDEAGLIALWNPAMERITGYRAEEVIGRSCRVLNFNRCLRKECPNGMADCGIFEYGKVDAKECALRHREGHDVPVVKNARVVRDPSGRLLGVVETVTDLTRLKSVERQMADARRRLGERHRFANLIGKSAAMQTVFDAVQQAAASDATVLVSGESGTGKELVAGAIHHHGLRAERPFVTVNCSALSESLLESELFGHVAGAFTGASRSRVGRFEEADGGTLFLDEIGDVSPFIQIKLLRVLQEREIERVGDSKRRKVDIRVIAATHRDLARQVEAGSFRQDLYYRIKVFPIRMPPLRERREDIPLLTRHFLDKFNRQTGKAVASVAPEGMQLLMAWPWRGNVRELENAIEHGFVLCRGQRIEPGDLPVEIRAAPRVPDPVAMDGPPRGGRAALGRERLIGLLAACDWNKAEVGRRTGYSRTAIWKFMKRWGIPLEPPPKAGGPPP